LRHTTPNTQVNRIKHRKDLPAHGQHGWQWLLLFLLTVAPVIHANDDSVFDEVATGIFVKFGRHLDIALDTVDQIANSGFIVGERSVAVIDPGGSAQASMRLISAVKAVTSLPISHVIVTHHHPDHSLGLFAFVTDDRTKPTLMGHSNLWLSMLQNLEFFRENFIRKRDDLNKQLQSVDWTVRQPITPIDITTTIDLGNRLLTLDPHQPAHTNTDLTILDLKTGTLWTGDLLVVDRLPALDGNLIGWINVLKQLAASEPEQVIPGHGDVAPWKHAGQPVLNYLNKVLETTRVAIKNGVTLSKFLEQDWSWTTLRWQLVAGQHQRNLSRAYTELEWE